MSRVVSPPWRFLLTTLDQQVLTFLDHRAINRQVHYYLRQAHTAAGRVYAADAEINTLHTDGEPFLAEGVRLLVGFRREGGDPPWVPRYAGFLTQPTRTTEADTQYIDFTAFSPRQYLYNRPVRGIDGNLPPHGGLVYKNERGSDILRSLIAETEAADGPTFIDTTTGHIDDTDPITITFQQTATVGDALAQLEQTGTMDVLLPAVWEPLANPGKLAQLNIYALAGQVQDTAIMAYDLFPHTLEDHDWLENGQDRANKIEFYTVDGRATPIVFDAASIAKYRTYFAQQNFPAQAGVTAIEAEAAVQLIQRNNHPTTLTVTPVPERAPIPLTEYDLADWLPTYISDRSGKQLADYFRVQEIPIQILDDAVETVVSMPLSNDLPAPTGTLPDLGNTSGDLPGPPTDGFDVAIYGFPVSGDDMTLLITT